MTSCGMLPSFEVSLNRDELGAGTDFSLEGGAQLCEYSSTINLSSYAQCELQYSTRTRLRYSCRDLPAASHLSGHPSPYFAISLRLGQSLLLHEGSLRRSLRGLCKLRTTISG